MDTSNIQLILADDDKDDCLLFREALDELGLSVSLTTVEDGEQLMDLLAEMAMPQLALLFLDMNMPRKNGVECLDEIRRSAVHHTLPVIMYSTSYDPAAISELYDKGAHYFFRKPTEFVKIKEVIHHTLTVAMPIAAQPVKEKFILSF